MNSEDILFFLNLQLVPKDLVNSSTREDGGCLQQLLTFWKSYRTTKMLLKRIRIFPIFSLPIRYGFVNSSNHVVKIFVRDHPASILRQHIFEPFLNHPSTYMVKGRNHNKMLTATSSAKTLLNVKKNHPPSPLLT